MIDLTLLRPDFRAVILGASGGIGSAFVDLVSSTPQSGEVIALSRTSSKAPRHNLREFQFDYAHPETLDAVANTLKSGPPLDLVIVATGFLHNEVIQPEKSNRQLSADALERNFLINTIGPSLAARAFLPLMRRDHKSVFCALSARVGSISDNRLGGWHSYRASKAALNMILKTMSIETARRGPFPIIMGLHPGTVDTGLSEPFQKNVPEGKLFTPEFSASKLLRVIDQSDGSYSGKVFDWDGKIVPP